MAHAAQSGEAGIPTYVEVYNRLYSDVTSGVYPPGSRLPGEVELAERYGTGRHTLRQALIILVEDGLVHKQKGSGNYVSETLPGHAQAAPAIANPILAYAKRPVSDIRTTHNFGPPTEVAQNRLGITASDIVLAANVAYLAEGEVIGHSFVQIPAAFIGDEGIDLHQSEQIGKLISETIYQQAKTAELFFRVIQAEGELLSQMGLCEGTVLIYIEQVLHARGGRGIARCKYYLLPEAYDIRLVLG